MAGREVRDFTNLSDPKGEDEGDGCYFMSDSHKAIYNYCLGWNWEQIADKKWSSNGGKDKTDDEDLAFKRMVAKMQEVAGERGGYLHGRGALDSDDLLYLKEQMEAEEDAERLRRRTEKRAFAAFKAPEKTAAILLGGGDVRKLLTIAHSRKGVSTLIYQHKAASLVDAASVTTLPSIRVEPKPRSGIRQNVLVKSIVEVKPKRLRCEEPSSRSGVARTTDAGTPSTSSREVEKNSGTSVPSHKPVAVEFANALGGLLGLTYESEDDSETEQEESQAQHNISGTRKGAHGFSGRVTLEGNRLQNFSQNDHSQSDVKTELSGS